MKFDLLIAGVATIFISVAQAQHDPPDRPDPCSSCDGKFLACRNVSSSLIRTCHNKQMRNWPLLQSIWCSIPGANCDFSCNIDTCNIAEVRNYKVSDSETRSWRTTVPLQMWLQQVLWLLLDAPEVDVGVKPFNKANWTDIWVAIHFPGDSRQPL